jgi:hypothetical protein
MTRCLTTYKTSQTRSASNSAYTPGPPASGNNFGVRDYIAQANTIDTVIAAISNVTEVVGTIFELLTSNALLTFCLAASLVGVGISVFNQLRGSLSNAVRPGLSSGLIIK